MYEHESNLPFAYDRAVGHPEQQSVVFYGRTPFIQAPELNELQRIMRGRHDRLGKLVAADGNRIDRADAVVDIDAETVTLTDGSIYVSGDVFPVSAAVLSDIPMTGRTEIGVRVTKTWQTYETHPELLGIVAGSLSEGEPGAAREVMTIAWAHVDDGGAGDFVNVYTMQDGTILDQTTPSILEPALQALAAYDRPNGNYIVSGCRVTALSLIGNARQFSIEQGEFNVYGLKRTRYAALRHSEEQAWEELAIVGETHIYADTAGSYTFAVAEGPIGVVSGILLTKEKTVTMTRGSTPAGADVLPDTSVLSVSNVSSGGTTYVPITSYNLVNNTIDWAPAGAEPAAGQTFNVTYRYRASVSPTSFSATSITVSGGVNGGEVIVSYTRKLPRIDRLGLRTDGSPVYIKGLPSRNNPLSPAVPDDVLNLCEIYNDWNSDPVVTNDGTRSMTIAEQWKYNNLVLDIWRTVALERIKTGIDSKENVTRKGLFVDPFLDDTYRDEGVAQTGAINNGMLQLAIAPTFYYATLVDPVTLDYVEEVIITQSLKTQCEKINPYANFTPLPAALKLSPSVDFWTESRTDWLSEQTTEFNRGVRTDGGPLQTTNSTNDVVDQRTEQIEFLRQISLTYTIKGFGPGEILEALTFDDINVKPAGTQTADGTGTLTGSFVIPLNVSAGTKVVAADGMGGSEATAMFVGQGTIEVDVMRRVTTVENWSRPAVTAVVSTATTPVATPTPSTPTFPNPYSPKSKFADPQAQMFAVNQPRQILGFDFYMCAFGDLAKKLLVDQVTMDNGYPTSDVRAEAIVPMTTNVPGWRSARFDLPLTSTDTETHAFVIKSDDNIHSIAVAKLGGFDTDQQAYVTSHPYTTGPRFSSVNAQTWTAHQDEALTFRAVAARYTAPQKRVNLGTHVLVNCSDLQVRAVAELPSSGCSVTFEVVRGNGTVYKLLPFQVLQLTEFLNETVTLFAVLNGTELLSPILYAPVELIAGKIDTSFTYITRAFPLGSAVRVTEYFKAYLPGGAGITTSISIDGGAWTALPLADTDPLAFPLWVENKYELTNKTGTLVRLRIVGTGGPSARLIVGDLSAGIF